MLSRDLLKRKLILNKSKKNTKKNGLMRIKKHNHLLKRIERKTRLLKLKLLRQLKLYTKKKKLKNDLFKKLLN